MAEVNEWQLYFDNHAPVYMEQWYTQNWRADVDFFEEVLQLPSGSRILDVGCGTGRHSVELVRRGYQVTGIDFSAGMLAEAKKAAVTAGVTVEWIQCDALDFVTDRPFDAAICMLEAAFALLTPRQDPIDHDMTILRRVNAALKPGARFLLHAPSAFKQIRELTQDEIDSGRFDPRTMVSHCTCTWETPTGEERTVVARARSYLPTELTMYLHHAGFVVEEMWGGDRPERHPIQLDAYMIMVLARKTAAVE
ncbi:MAG: cyclopropane-fatty-acyl-phospholipid synthase [Chloroflexi bacterium]|nr:MAG: cyclopropane-fatty-acyl-phospholipid synthase [Chloroflexota bacterium]